MTITAASVNLFNYANDEAADGDRYRQVEQLVCDLDADLIAVQELVASGEDRSAKAPAAAAGLRQFAAATGRACEIDGEQAVALGGGRHHTGLLWRSSRVTPVLGSLQRLERANAGMWHSATFASFVLDESVTVRIGSVQLSPFSQVWNRVDARQLARAMTSSGVPALLGGDFNGIASDDLDPYTTGPSHPEHSYQHDACGRLDRRVDRRLQRAGLRDCARHLESDPEVTTGHHQVDPHPP